MTRNQFKAVSTIAILVVGAYVFAFEPQVIQGLARTLVRFVAFGLSAAFAYQCVDSIWAALSGRNGKTSAPVGNPEALGNRGAGIIWGCMCGLISAGIAGFALGIWGGPFA